MEPSESHYHRRVMEPYKSWGEQQIGLLLDRNDIAFQYEYPLAVVDRGMVRLYYPDFRLPEYGMIIEYFGVNGNPEYDRQREHKMKVYREAGIEGLFLGSDCFKGYWPDKIIDQIGGVLNHRLESFSSLVVNHREPESYKLGLEKRGATGSEILGVDLERTSKPR